MNLLYKSISRNITSSRARKRIFYSSIESGSYCDMFMEVNKQKLLLSSLFSVTKCTEEVVAVEEGVEVVMVVAEVEVDSAEVEVVAVVSM